MLTPLIKRVPRTNVCTILAPSESATSREEAADVLMPALAAKLSAAQSTAACAGPALGGGPAQAAAGPDASC